MTAYMVYEDDKIKIVFSDSEAKERKQRRKKKRKKKRRGGGFDPFTEGD